jgi:Zn-dependent protease
VTLISNERTSSRGVSALLFGLAAAPAFAWLSFSSDPLGAVLTLVLLVMSLGFHEAAHAWTAWKCGDSTGKDLGRITLNPIPHIDLMMTIIVPVIALYMSGFLFGGAKPVPVNFHRLKNPWRDMSLVALAGPMSNLFLAVFFMVLMHLFVTTGWYNGAQETMRLRLGDMLPRVLFEVVRVNVLLAVFNLIPIPPLDGSRVMAWLLPDSMRAPYLSIERYGIIIVFALVIYVQPFGQFTFDMVRTVTHTLGKVVWPGGPF